MTVINTARESMLAPLQRLFGGDQSAQSSGDATTAERPETPGERGQTRGQPPTWGEIKQGYKRGPSFARFLPWVEYLPDSGCLLLEDGVSVGIAAEVEPVPTEGRSQDTLAALRDQMEAAFQDAADEYDANPWVIQVFARDEIDPGADAKALAAHVDSTRAGDDFTDAWLAGMRRHLDSIAQPGGVFTDDTVTGTAWRGQTRRMRLVLYRWVGAGTTHAWAEDDANHVYDKLEAGLSGAGLRLKRMDGAAFHDWMLRWFNPAPGGGRDDPLAFYDRVAYPGDDAIAKLPQFDLGEDVLHNCPRADAENGVWYFDERPHRVIPVEELRQPPDIGHVTGERPRAGGRHYNAIMDRLPEDTVMSLTIVAIPQEPLEDHINLLKKKAVGDSVTSDAVREDCDTARDMLKNDHKLYQQSLAFYIHGANDRELTRRTLTLTSQLQQANLRAVEARDEIAPLNTYLRWLPMGFDPSKDKQNWYTRLAYVQHLANLSPFFGRSRGTGRPGLSFFNRGGGTFTFDPLSPQDRAKNAHMLVFGPTGAGKSATLNAIFSQIQAMRRPRLFIVEKGNSFGLLAEDFERHGLSVHKVRLAPGAAPPMPLFADAHRLLETRKRSERQAEDRVDTQRAEDAAPLDDVDEQDDEEDDTERDLLGEMEITARLMITGGDPDEEAAFRRADRAMVRDALYAAARTTFEAGQQCLTEHVRDALVEISKDDDRPAARREKAYDMAESMGLFCSGFDGQVFNTEGQVWPEADVTLVDLAHYASDGYEAQLALSVISLTNTITGIAERDQYSGRPIVQAMDEVHAILVNPLLSPYLVKIGKMGRKLNHWLWLATQNLEDFPDSAVRLLNMIEWYICLALPKDEIKQLGRFKKLSDEQTELLESATKAPGQYTEGVVLADRIEALFRIVPQSHYLALAGTEPEEKAERRRVMNEHGCSELDAARHIAAEMDKNRGITIESSETTTAEQRG
ncbi:conjugative transfer ATPase [Salinisphaera orenii]|uniref:conjugative transfer ATPase n=1 Tax=Salinisphaera orenii TaxID=856731 RepID=UPI000DBE4057